MTGLPIVEPEPMTRLITPSGRPRFLEKLHQEVRRIDGAAGRFPDHRVAH